MKLWGVPKTELELIVKDISDNLYKGNVRFKRAPERNGMTDRSPLIFTLTVIDSAKHGARRSKEGRRIAAACWHVHRDIIQAIFNAFSSVRLQTVMADYKGATEFELKYPETGYKNIGSQFSPLYASEACEC